MLCVLVVLSACKDDGGAAPDATLVVDAGPDAMHHPDDGYGNVCTPMGGTNGHLYTECMSQDGLPGVCVFESANNPYLCRRFCATSAGGCPTGQVPTPGQEGTCWCEPKP